MQSNYFFKNINAIWQSDFTYGVLEERFFKIAYGTDYLWFKRS
jgi:hypothetical protein